MISLLLLSLYMHHAGIPETQYVLGSVEGMPIALEVTTLGGLDADGYPLMLETQAAESFMRMRSAARNDGLELNLNYAHRSMNQQVSLYKKNKRLASPPGLSPHQQGIAIDVQRCTDKVGQHRYKTKICKWLGKHAAEYGFRRTISYEPWHWEFAPTAETHVARLNF